MIVDVNQLPDVETAIFKTKIGNGVVVQVGTSGPDITDKVHCKLSGKVLFLYIPSSFVIWMVISEPNHFNVIVKPRVVCPQCGGNCDEILASMQASLSGGAK